MLHDAVCGPHYGSSGAIVNPKGGRWFSLSPGHGGEGEVRRTMSLPWGGLGRVSERRVGDMLKEDGAVAMS